MGRGPGEASAAEEVDAAPLARRVRLLTWLAAVLGVIAIAGVGLGVYALARDEDDASEQRVERIDRAIDQMEKRLAAASEESDTVRLSRDLDNKATKRDVQRIEEDADAARDSVEDSDARLDAAARRLARMERRLDRVADGVEALRERRRR